MSGFSHLIHLILCLFTGFLWIPIYVLCIISAGNSRKRMEDRKRDEQIELLKQLVREKR